MLLMQYLIELDNVPNEIPFYIEDLKDYGEITRYSEKYPTYVWITSPWQQDILEVVFGVKKIWAKRYDRNPKLSVLKISHEKGLR